MIETFQPLLDAARGLDLQDPEAARELLEKRFPFDAPDARALEARLLEHLERGEIANRGEAPLRYGRVCKASPETHDYSIDVVHMSVPGPRHRHPNGEIDYCIALDGQPTFDGHAPGWVVFGADSVHVPTVSGGTMLIVYLLPGGEIEFLG